MYRQPLYIRRKESLLYFLKKKNSFDSSPYVYLLIYISQTDVSTQDKVICVSL